MKKLSLALGSILIISSLSISTYGQNQGGIPDPNAPVPPEKAKAIRRLMEMNGGLKVGQQFIDLFIPTLKRSASHVPESVWDEIEKEFASDLSADKVAELNIPIYSKHFTLEEINELIEFYQTPVGKKMASVLPQIASEAVQRSSQWSVDLLKRIQQSLKEKGYATTKD